MKAQLEADTFTFLKPLKRILLASLFVLTAILLAACGVATPTPAPTPTDQYLDTPTLIAQAFGRGEITEEERWLYLAYALYEHESLPIQFRSKYAWFGEEYVLELREALTPPEVICSMSPHVRSEFLRLFDLDTTCH